MDKNEEKVSVLEKNQYAQKDIHGELSEKIEFEITYCQHIECGVVRQCQILFERNEMGDSHDYKSDEDQGKCAAGAEEHGNEDHYVGKAKIDRGHGYRVQCSEKRQFPVHEP